MQKIINIKSKKAIKELERFKRKKYSMTDIRFDNVHLKKINNLLRIDIFSKNDLYINSSTLWELMQPVGDSGSHNYHGLSAEDILESINMLMKPYCIIKAKNNRFIFVPIFISSFSAPLMIVVEVGASLINNKTAGINKIVTIYPKSDLEDYLEKIDSKYVIYQCKIK